MMDRDKGKEFHANTSGPTDLIDAKSLLEGERIMLSGAFLSEEEREACWYCIHTKRYKERWVAHQLAEICSEVYLPLLRERRRGRRQESWCIDSLFPGYVFARFALALRFRAVRYTPGVLELVSSRANEPFEVEPLIISTLRARSPQGWLEVQPPPFILGEELEVVDGPFQGLRALFQQELRAGERVAVLLELLSSQVRVELSRTSVRRKFVAPRLQSAV